MATLICKSDKKLGGFRAFAVTSTVTNGKRIRQWIPLGHFPTRRDGEREFNRVAQSLNQERVQAICQARTAAKQSPVLSSVIPDYIQGWRRSQGGLDRAKLSLKAVNAHLGHLKLIEIDPPTVERYINERVKENSQKDGVDGRRSINLEINTLGALMTWALKQGLIPRHPFKDASHSIASYHIKIAETTPTVLTFEEIQKMTEALSGNPHGLTIFLGYLLTGMRKGELAQLTWEMVDLSAGLIRFTTPKTGRPRVIPIPFSYRKLLVRMKHEYPGKVCWKPRKPEQMKYVYCDFEGKPFGRYIGRLIPRIARNLHLRRIHLHALRSTYATWLASHVGPFELMSALGHSTLKMTQRYVNLANVTPTMREGLEKMSGFMGLNDGLVAEKVDEKVDGPVLELLPSPESIENIGGRNRVRTCDPLRVKQVL